MISVTVKRVEDKIVELTVRGHSGYADYGQDVVCAAVSAITQTALLGLIHYAGNVRYERDEKKGYLHIVVPNEPETVCRGIVETAVIGLKDIAKGYGTFVRVEEK